MANTNGDGVTFGEWLLLQWEATGSLGILVGAARTDPKFPRRGSPDDVRKRLNDTQADGEMHDAVDDAEMDWRSY